MNKYRVNFYTEDGVLMAWYPAKTEQEARGLRRHMKNGYATIEVLL